MRRSLATLRLVNTGLVALVTEAPPSSKHKAQARNTATIVHRAARRSNSAAQQQSTISQAALEHWLRAHSKPQARPPTPFCE